MFGNATKRTAGTFLLAAITAVLVAACGGGGKAAAPSAAATTSTPTPASVPADVSVGYSAPMQTLDPDLALDYAVNALHFIGGNLYELKGSGSVPGLAANTVISGNGLTWTITLKKGLKFSNGLPLTSADVKATFDRSLKDPANVNPNLFQPITSVDAPNPLTVVLHLNRPYPSLKKILGYPEFPIFPASLVHKKGFFNAPISAGPYKLDSWGGGSTAVFSINPYYAGPKPLVPKITFVVVPDANTRLAEVESGELDIAYSLPPDLISQINAPANKQVVTEYGLDTLTMRTTQSPLSDLAVRRAISEAINRAQLAELVWLNKVKPQGGLWPSTMTGYDPSISTAVNDAGAKALLKGTPCASGCSLTLTYSSAANPEEGGEAPIIQANLKSIGINVRLDNVDVNTYYGTLSKFKFQLALGPLYDATNIPDGISTYGLLYTGPETNYSGLDVPGMQAAVHAAVVSTGTPHLTALQKLSDLIQQYVPWTPLTGRAIVAATRVSPSLIAVQPTTVIGVARKGGGIW